MRYTRIAAIAFGMAACLSLSAQNLNPTVEVSRTYEGKLLEVTKPEMVMNVPDSLLKVKVDFDYDVFETPYRGAYEFTPYLTDMKPKPDAYSGKNLYLRAGAGFSLNPEFTGVWSPSLSGNFQMSVYGFHKSYFGKYREIVPSVKDGAISYDASDNKQGGHNMSNRFGISGRNDFRRDILTFDFGYYGVSTDAYEFSDHSYNAFDAALRFRSNNPSTSYFLYDVAASLRMAGDKNSVLTTKLSETDFVFDSSFGPVFDRYSRVIVDVDANIAAYTNAFESNVGSLAVTPKYIFDKGRWHMDLGLRLSTIIRGNGEGSLYTNHSQKSQNFYPDAFVSYHAVYDRLMLYAQATGGDNINTYGSIVRKNHYFNQTFANVQGVLLDNTIERVNASIGVKGSFAHNFQYDIKGGYTIVSNGLVEGFSSKNYMQNGTIVPTPAIDGVDSPGSGYSDGDVYPAIPSVSYCDYQMAYATMLLSWNPGSFSFDGDFTYRNARFTKNLLTYAFGPSAFSGNLRAMYSYKSRVTGGLWAEFSSKRECDAFLATDSNRSSIPGYVDLGLLVECQFNRHLGLYLQAGNLLNSRIQRNVGYLESPINIIGGVTLSF